MQIRGFKPVESPIVTSTGTIIAGSSSDSTSEGSSGRGTIAALHGGIGVSLPGSARACRVHRPARVVGGTAALCKDLTSFTRKAFNEINPGDPFLENWHVDCLCWHLETCYRRDITRLIITLPPRYLKSICASVAFPAWVLGQDPTRRLICVSYSQDLARKHALDTRAPARRAAARGKRKPPNARDHQAPARHTSVRSAVPAAAGPPRRHPDGNGGQQLKTESL
jgi:hypothetical protein